MVLLHNMVVINCVPLRFRKDLRMAFAVFLIMIYDWDLGFLSLPLKLYHEIYLSLLFQVEQSQIILFK